LLSAQDVRELLAVKSEGKNLDYKQSMNWAAATANQKAAVIKDVLAMANTQDGGKIIFGVRDTDFEAIGMSDDDFQSFDATRFSDFLNRYSDPSFACAVHKLAIDNTQFIVIDVPEFTTVPIICKSDANDAQGTQVLKRGAIYIRTNRASSEAVPDAEGMRELMNRAVVKRGDELLRMVERLINGKPVALDQQSANEIMAEISDADAFIVERLPEEFRHAGHWELEFCVLPYVGERIANLASVSTFLEESQITLRGWYFPHFDRQNTSNFARGVQSNMTQSSTGHLEGYRAYQSGTLVWRGTLWEDVVRSMRAGQKALSFVGVILQVTEYFLFARRYYDKVAPDATAKLVIRVTDTQDRILKSFDIINEGDLHGDYLCREPRVEVQTKCTVAELIASYDELARKAIRRIYELFNWNNSREEMTRGWQERLLNRRL
jgi:Putative DNA-binding domain